MDLRWFCTWGVLINALGFFLKWCGLFQDVGPDPDWQQVPIEPIEEYRVE